MSLFVLDASVVLAVLQEEEGTHIAEPHMEGGYLSVVNLVEVMTRLVDSGKSAGDAEQLVSALDVELVDFGFADAIRATELRETTASAGLSLGDRACLALGQRLQKPVLTGDRAWKSAFLSQPVEFIR